MDTKNSKNKSKKKKNKGNSDDDGGENKPKDDVEPVAFFKMFRYSTKTDKFMYFIGVLSALATGLTTPANSYIFGNLSNVN